MYQVCIHQVSHHASRVVTIFSSACVSALKLYHSISTVAWLYLIQVYNIYITQLQHSHTIKTKWKNNGENGNESTSNKN